MADEFLPKCRCKPVQMSTAQVFTAHATTDAAPAVGAAVAILILASASGSTVAAPAASGRDARAACEMSTVSWRWHLTLRACARTLPDASLLCIVL